MTLHEAIDEWKSKKRRMGCVAATNWLTQRVPDLKTTRLHRYTKNGDYYGHVVATDGFIIIDLSPYNDIPRDYNKETDGDLLPNIA